MTLSLISSCITSKGLLKSGGKKKSGTIEERTEIDDNPAIQSLHLTFGSSKKTGFGLDAAKMLNNSSRLSGSLFLLTKGLSFIDEEQQSTPNNLLIRNFMSLSYSYPIISNASYRSGKMYLRRTFNSSYEARASEGVVYFLKDKFKVLHFINFVGGIAHGYTNFHTEVFTKNLIESYPDASASVLGPFNDVLINSGTYYGKIGLSSTQVINTSLNGTVDDFNLSGRISRELNFTLNALIGISGTIPTTNVNYRYFENGAYVYAEENVDFKELLDYNRFGFEAGFHWIEYLPYNLSFKYGATIGLMPGYHEQGDWFSLGIFQAKLGFGFGSISK